MTRPRLLRAESDAANCPLASAVQNAWLEAVRSGTQDRNVAGFTPMTLTGRSPALICAPSKAITCRTPVILLSRDSCWPVIPAGATTSRSGRMICWNVPASRAISAADIPGRPAGPPGGGITIRVWTPTTISRNALQPATTPSAGVITLRTVARGPRCWTSQRWINLGRIRRRVIAIHPSPALWRVVRRGANSRRPSDSADVPSWRRLAVRDAGQGAGRAGRQPVPRGAGQAGGTAILGGGLRRPHADVDVRPRHRSADRLGDRPLRAGRDRGRGGLGRLRALRAAGREAGRPVRAAPGAAAADRYLRGQHHGPRHLRGVPGAAVDDAGQRRAGRGIHAVAGLDGPGALEHAARRLAAAAHRVLARVGPR